MTVPGMVHFHTMLHKSCLVDYKCIGCPTAVVMSQSELKVLKRVHPYLGSPKPQPGPQGNWYGQRSHQVNTLEVLAKFKLLDTFVSH